MARKKWLGKNLLFNRDDDTAHDDVLAEGKNEENGKGAVDDWALSWAMCHWMCGQSPF